MEPASVLSLGRPVVPPEIIVQSGKDHGAATGDMDAAHISDDTGISTACALIEFNSSKVENGALQAGGISDDASIVSGSTSRSS